VTLEIRRIPNHNLPEGSEHNKKISLDYRSRRLDHGAAYLRIECSKSDRNLMSCLDLQLSCLVFAYVVTVILK
jgi:hypothetical protein